MTDKRTGSSHPSARPPLPSIAPPTDDIDSEWGADEVPVVAKGPEVAASPARAPSHPPAPEPPQARPSSPAAAARPSSPAASNPAPSNPLRKQTLLGMAPVIPQRSEGPVAASAPRSEPPRPSATASEPPRPSQPAAPAPASDNPLRKQTLLGIAPVVATGSAPPVAAAKDSAPPAAVAAAPAPAAEPAKEPASSVTARAAAQATAADAVDSDKPITRDVASNRPRPAAPRVAVSPSDTDDLPELRSRRPRWLLPVAAAAVIGLGVFGLRKLDRPPTPVPVAAAPKPGPAPATPTPATPQADDSDDTDSDPDPTTRTEPEPLKAASAAPEPAAPEEKKAAAAPAKAAAPQPGAQTGEALDAADAAREPADTSARELKSINVSSDPPGARMFWKGKEVGTTPFVLEIPAGQRRSYELGRPGFVTRKVVIDGSKSDISIGLKPEG